MRENMRYAHFLQNMRNMLRSHDRYKPVSLFSALTVLVADILCVKSHLLQSPLWTPPAS